MKSALYAGLIGALSAAASGVILIPIVLFFKWLGKAGRKQPDIKTINFTDDTEWQCPVCSMSNVGICACERCGYVPEQIKERLA